MNAMAGKKKTGGSAPQNAEDKEQEQMHSQTISVEQLSALTGVPDTLGHKWGTKNGAHLGVFKQACRLLGFDGDIALSKDTNTLWRFLVERIVHAALEGHTITITADGIEFDAEPIDVKTWLQMKDADWAEFLESHS